MSVHTILVLKSGKGFIELINSNIPKDGIETYMGPFSGSIGNIYGGW